MFAFRKVCWRQCLYFHCLNKKWGGGWEWRGGAGGTSTTHCDHTVPSCPRQTKSRLSISQNWFSRDVLQKDEMCRMQHGKAQRVCLSCVHKENVGVCLAPFVVPHFLLGRSQHFPAHTCKLNMHKFKSQPSLPPVHTRCYLESYKWLLKANIYNTIKKKKNPKFVVGQRFYLDGYVSPWVSFSGVSSLSGQSCSLGLQQLTK